MNKLSVDQIKGLEKLHDCLYENVNLFIKLTLHKSELGQETINLLLVELRMNCDSLIFNEITNRIENYPFIKDSIDASHEIAEKARLVQVGQLDIEEFLKSFKEYSEKCSTWKHMLSDLYK